MWKENEFFRAPKEVGSMERNTNDGFLQKIFHLSENHTDVKTEVVAGITTFMTMAYILAVNPSILGAAGMDSGAVFTATALASLVATLLMAGLANYPFVLAPGMGLNAYFAYTVVLNMGYTWEMALAAVFIEGILFILLSLTNVREAIFNAIPMNLKHAVSVGIGLFIAFIGLQNAKVVVDGATLVTMFSFKGSIAGGTFHSVGITVLLAIIGILITAVLVVKNVKGNILWGILATWALGMICQAVGLYQPNPELGMYSVFPDFSRGFGVPSMAPTFFKLDFSKILSVDFLVVMFAFLFVDMFDTLGTLIGVASKADMLDKDGKLPQIRGALLADAVGTSVGALFGTSTTTTFVESAAGVAEGGRTGLTAVVAAILFGLSLFLSPIFLAIPSFATAPALVIVGFLMMTSVTKVDFSDFTEALPSYIAIIAMPFMYSISEGIAMGVISYVFINVVTGNAKKKKISVLMYILAVLFVLKYVLI
jgi:AGZA family xanthine/uracil permease-like MFS transporter